MLSTLSRQLSLGACPLRELHIKLDPENSMRFNQCLESFPALRILDVGLEQGLEDEILVDLTGVHKHAATLQYLQIGNSRHAVGPKIHLSTNAVLTALLKLFSNFPSLKQLSIPLHQQSFPQQFSGVHPRMLVSLYGATSVPRANNSLQEMLARMPNLVTLNFLPDNLRSIDYTDSLAAFRDKCCNLAEIIFQDAYRRKSEAWPPKLRLISFGPVEYPLKPSLLHNKSHPNSRMVHHSRSSCTFPSWSVKRHTRPWYWLTSSP